MEGLKNKKLEAHSARDAQEASPARVADVRHRHAEAVVSELRRAKAELEKSNQELTRSNQELRQFAAVASHDLQEPLRSITSFCNLLNEDYHGRLDADADDYIERIISGAKRMKALVTGLLSYSLIDRDDHPAFQEVDFQEVVGEVLANLQSSIDEAGAVISVGGLPRGIGDRLQLVQLLQNLIGNALLYRGDQLPRIEVAARKSADGWEFSVRDNGIGIAQEHHQQIFEVFKRLHSRDKYPGTGIGLAVCKKIVQRHKGRIWVDSDPGCGSIFRFTIRLLMETAP